MGKKLLLALLLLSIFITPSVYSTIFFNDWDLLENGTTPINSQYGDSNYFIGSESLNFTLFINLQLTDNEDNVSCKYSEKDILTTTFMTKGNDSYFYVQESIPQTNSPSGKITYYVIKCYNNDFENISKQEINFYQIGSNESLISNNFVKNNSENLTLVINPSFSQNKKIGDWDLFYILNLELDKYIDWKLKNDTNEKPYFTVHTVNKSQDYQNINYVFSNSYFIEENLQYKTDVFGVYFDYPLNITNFEHLDNEAVVVDMETILVYCGVNGYMELRNSTFYRIDNSTYFGENLYPTSQCIEKMYNTFIHEMVHFLDIGGGLTGGDLLEEIFTPSGYSTYNTFPILDVNFLNFFKNQSSLSNENNSLINESINFNFYLSSQSGYGQNSYRDELIARYIAMCYRFNSDFELYLYQIEKNNNNPFCDVVDSRFYPPSSSTDRTIIEAFEHTMNSRVFDFTVTYITTIENKELIFGDTVEVIEQGGQVLGEVTGVVVTVILLLIPILFVTGIIAVVMTILLIILKIIIKIMEHKDTRKKK